jgi:hypothetical protein
MVAVGSMVGVGAIFRSCRSYGSCGRYRSCRSYGSCGRYGSCSSYGSVGDIVAVEAMVAVGDIVAWYSLGSGGCGARYPRYGRDRPTLH